MQQRSKLLSRRKYSPMQGSRRVTAFKRKTTQNKAAPMCEQSGVPFEEKCLAFVGDWFDDGDF